MTEYFEDKHWEFWFLLGVFVGTVATAVSFGIYLNGSVP
jgi:hypothetical protein